MHAIVVGCGRVGSMTALELAQGGHEVVVVDRRAAAFRRLGSGFAGRTVEGVGFDRRVLTACGITTDSAVLAVTSGDNSNILIARVAREMFGVERVVARIYDPKRAIVYQRLGIPTVATVTWTSARVLRSVLPIPGEVDWSDPTGTHVLIERRVPRAAAGASVAQLEDAGLRVCMLTRSGQAQIPAHNVLLQEDDVIHVMAHEQSAGELDVVLAAAHGGAR